jgi:hypothetical protein
MFGDGSEKGGNDSSASSTSHSAETMGGGRIKLCADTFHNNIRIWSCIYGAENFGISLTMESKEGPESPKDRCNVSVEGDNYYGD